MSDLVAAAAQFTVSLGDIEANVAVARSALERLAEQGCRLVALPEMWSTGYDYRRLPELAQRTPEIVRTLESWSDELGMVIVGSLPEPHGDKVCNTAYVIDRGKTLATYRKMHLFSLMGEDRSLDPGDSWTVVDTSVGRIGVFICYDLRFPELARRLALEGARILVVPAEWPKPREDHWRTLLRARAIENQLFIVAANCCGIQGKLDFFGMSLIIGPKGEVLAEGGDLPTEIVAPIDFALMDDWRGKITCFADRRPDCY